MVAFLNPPPDDAGAKRILDDIAAMDAAQQLSHAELADAEMSLITQFTGPEDDLETYATLNELLARFEECAGIERSEESGEIIEGGTVP